MDVYFVIGCFVLIEDVKGMIFCCSWILGDL